jgi:hypothetical protein
VATIGPASSTADPIFARRHCYRLAYARKQESAHHRGVWGAQGIRMRLGGSVNLYEALPEQTEEDAVANV